MELFYPESQPYPYRWQDGAVDPRAEHIELRFGHAPDTAYEDWVPLARLGPPQEYVFPVEWLLSPDTPEHEDMIAGARHSLDFFLVQRRYNDPWGYAFYWCGTAGNMYSDVHWSYCAAGGDGPPRSSKVVRGPDGKGRWIRMHPTKADE